MTSLVGTVICFWLLANSGEIPGGMAVVISLIYLGLRVRASAKQNQLDNYSKFADLFTHGTSSTYTVSDTSNIFPSVMSDCDSPNEQQKLGFHLMMGRYFGIADIVMAHEMRSLVSHNSHQIVSWRNHFFSQRKWCFGLNILLGVLVFDVRSNALTSGPANLTAVIGYGFITALSVAGSMSKAPRLHAIIVSITGGFTLLVYGVATFSPVTL